MRVCVFFRVWKFLLGFIFGRERKPDRQRGKKNKANNYFLFCSSFSFLLYEDDKINVNLIPIVFKS